MFDQVGTSIVIETKDISQDLKMTISKSFDDSQLFLSLDYLKGKFTIEKKFNNNYDGRKMLEGVKKEFTSEEDVKRYFGLK